MNIHSTIDEFVACVDPAGDIFRRIEGGLWVEALEAKLPKRFPVSFRSLITRYAFQPFEAAGISFFANTGEDSDEELAVTMFRDRNISEVTMKAGYLQFARPEDGSYDPICFDASRKVSNREFPIVRLDHEEILCRDRIVVSKPVADSFYRFAADFVSRA